MDWLLQQASALTTSSTLHTTDSNDNDGTRPYSENSATGLFYNWCFLQLCGVAIDVGINLPEVLPLFVDQALPLTPVSRRRLLDSADNRMVLEFQRRIGEFRPLLGLHGTVGDTDCQQVVMDHTRFSVLSSYAIWFNLGRSTFISTSCVQAQLRDILSDSNGAQLRDNGHLVNPCYPYIRQFQLLQPDAVRIDGCNPHDLALFFSAQ